MILKVRNSSNGIGDQVCGLYACQALKNRYPEATVEYYSKRPDWLADAKEVVIKPYEHYVVIPPARADVYANYQGENEQLQLTRKEWYVKQMGYPELKPCAPVMKRNYRGNGGYILLSPFSAWKEREWPMKKWTMLEKKLTGMGYKTIILTEPGRAAEADELAGVKLCGQPPAEVINAILNAYCVIGNDSGMVHVAGMYNVPAIGIIAHFSHQRLYSHTGILSVTGPILEAIPVERVIDKLSALPQKNSKGKRLFTAGDLGAFSEGGIYNTSLVEHKGEHYMLSRAEEHSERERNINDTSSPLLSKLVNNSLAQSSVRLNFNARVEDFRLFNWKDALYCGHPMVFYPSGKTVQVISKVNAESNSLDVKYFPVLADRMLNKVEKNWAFFQAKKYLYFVYSVNPFRIYRFNETGICEPHAVYNLNPAWVGDDMLSCSTNPVKFDSDNYIMFFHQRQQGVYAQGIVLFDCETFAPTWYSAQPFYKSAGNGGINPHVCYFMGCSVDNDNVIVTAGMGDFNTELFTWSKKEIMENLVKANEMQLHRA